MKSKMKTSKQATSELSSKVDADKYLGFIEPEISEILKDTVFLSLIKSDGVALEYLISIINAVRVNL